jgi:hypothetical protein
VLAAGGGPARWPLRVELEFMQTSMFLLGPDAGSDNHQMPLGDIGDWNCGDAKRAAALRDE